MRRITFALAAAALACLPPDLVAIGVGPIAIDSELNQPFDARIELMDSADYPPDAIIVEQAGPETYRKLGIERVFALVYLSFKVIDPGEGNKLVRISSREPIREPSFDLLLEVAAGSGRLLKKYSVVLGADAIEAAARPAATATVTAPGAARATPSPPAAVAVAAPATAATAATAAVPAPPAAGEQYGPVQAGETLWSIASRLRPDSAVTVQQTMLALFHGNPQAFENGRLDGLKRGQMLTVPGRDLIAAIDADAAFAEVQQRLAAP